MKKRLLVNDFFKLSNANIGFKDPSIGLATLVIFDLNEKMTKCGDFTVPHRPIHLCLLPVQTKIEELIIFNCGVLCGV